MNRLVVLHGQSGLGKTSLLRSGLFPRLRAANFLPIDIRLDQSEAAPPLLHQIKAVIERAINGVRSNSPKPAADESLWEFFHRRDVGFQSAENRIFTPTLVLDQFEQAFIFAGKHQTRIQAMLEELVALAQNSVPRELAERIDQDAEFAKRFDFDGAPLHLVLAVRSDYLFALNRDPMSRCARTLVNIELQPLNGIQALEVVRKPAPDLIDEVTAAAVVRFSAGVSDDAPLAEFTVVPPLLSMVCRELNERRKQTGRKRIDLELLEAQPMGILEDFYESCFLGVPLEVRCFVEDRLISAGGYREAVLIESAISELQHQEIAQPDKFLDLLIDRRLLRVFEERDLRRIELVHDLLIGIVRRSRDERHRVEAQEKLAEQRLLEERRRKEAEQKQREAEEKHREAEALRAKAVEAERNTRKALIRSRFYLLIAIFAFSVAVFYAFKSEWNKRLADTAAFAARQAEAELRIATATKDNPLVNSLGMNLCLWLAPRRYSTSGIRGRRTLNCS
jgi:hypothetical protein